MEYGKRAKHDLAIHENVKANGDWKIVSCSDTMTRYSRRHKVKKPTRIAIKGFGSRSPTVSPTY